MRSRWAKVLPWYYTDKRQPSRAAELAEALKAENVAKGMIFAYHRHGHDHFYCEGCTEDCSEGPCCYPVPIKMVPYVERAEDAW